MKLVKHLLSLCIVNVVVYCIAYIDYDNIMYRYR